MPRKSKNLEGSPRTSGKGSPETSAEPAAKAHPIGDLRGTSRLVIDAVTGITDIVEDMHRQIGGMAPAVGKSKPGRTRGITGLVYRSVRGITEAVGFGLDSALARLTPLLGPETSSPRREAVQAALNGVLGDYLAASGNPLAIPMHLRRQGYSLELDRPSLAKKFARSNGKLLVLVHGLCMNDLQWQRDGHDHGAALAKDLGFTALYLHYNSGRPIHTNGEAFAASLEELVQAWPVPVSELVIIGHSMGGLVARGACHYGRLADHAWLRGLTKLVFLGTPHHGAPLERAGNWVDLLLGVSPYSAPFARLGKIRSAGIKDLRHGYFLDEGETKKRHAGDTAPIPRRVKCFAIAASKQAAPGGAGKRVLGDGLVPVPSALAQQTDAARNFSIPKSRQYISYGCDHFDLLSRADVYERIKRWLS